MAHRLYPRRLLPLIVALLLTASAAFNARALNLLLLEYLFETVRRVLPDGGVVPPQRAAPRSPSPVLPLALVPEAQAAEVPPSGTEPASVSVSEPPPDLSLRGMMGNVRFVPELAPGKATGLRVFGIGPASLLAKLGFQNADLIESINGYTIADPAQALEAYARLRRAQELSVVVRRGGRAVQLDYHLN